MCRSSISTYTRTLTTLVVLLMIGTGCTIIPKGVNQPSAGSMTENRAFTETWWNYYKRALAYSEKGAYPSAMRDLQQAVQLNDFDRWHSRTPDNEVIDYFPHRELGIIHFHRKEYTKAVEQLEYSLESEESSKALFFLDLARSAGIKRDGVDHSPPVIYLETSTAKEITAAFVKQLEGLVKDDTLVASIDINDHRIPLVPASKTHIFTYDFPLQEGDNQISVSAEDLSGKSAKKEIHVIGDRLGPVIEILSAAVVENMYSISGRVNDTGGLASLHINGHLWPITGTFGGYNFTFTQKTGDMRITARDRAGNMTEIKLNSDDFDGRNETVSASPDKLPEKENDPPLILIEGIRDQLETYDDSITFQVKVSDDDRIHSLFVNTLPVFMTSGKKIYFTLKKQLVPGLNELYFVAFDTRGNKSIHKISVTRKVDNIFLPAARMRIAILPFLLTGDFGIQPQVIFEALSGILRDQKRFQLAGPRESQLIKGGFDRHKSQISAHYPAVGALLTGSIHISAGYAEVAGQLIEPQSSEIIAFNDVFGKVREPGDIFPLLDALMNKFNDDFPIRLGQVTHTTEDAVRINLGTKDGIRKHTQFIVYRDSPPIFHPVLKTVSRGDPDIIGYIQVTAVDEQSARARIIEKNTDIRKFDRVIAR